MTDPNNNANPWGPLMAPWLQAMRLWSNAAAQFVPPGVGTDWMRQLAQVVPGAYPSTGFAARGIVSVQVASRRPVEVAVHLEPGAESMRISVDPLVASDGAGAAPITGVTLDHHPGRLKVSLSVADDQPAGTYVGLVRDDAGARRGEVRAVISAG